LFEKCFFFLKLKKIIFAKFDGEKLHTFTDFNYLTVHVFPTHDNLKYLRDLFFAYMIKTPIISNFNNTFFIFLLTIPMSSSCEGTIMETALSVVFKLPLDRCYKTRFFDYFESQTFI
jgi:hypothetical protein